MNTNVQTEHQPTSYGLQEVLNTTACHDNAKGITLSNETRTLIECRARLSDLYSDVVDTMHAYWGGEQEGRITEQFCNAFYDLDTALLGLMADIIADTMNKNQIPANQAINRDFWCSGRGSNPYGHFCPRDFKSLLSTNSNTRAIRGTKIGN